ncbi:uncharacterized protein LOC111866046 isoform X2 [Cryptotermes secundus]|uniref:uncharacterized protein LOC111866046 isoform X2 n=1 Tax=Cryptotermes secundus TaxID=105785 RepID=UPI000CD7C87D|nr:uncharacterized protein LOC111866046 isoform X2 [Cryptotermes secundus]
MDPSIFPEEIWIKILTYCDVKDILSCSSTCKYLNKVVTSDYLWKLKWTQLESVCKFNFPDVHGARLNHKEVCMRLHTILQSDTVFRRCYHCMEFSCHSYCVEKHGSKVVVDIGNKFTWIVTPSFGVRRHFTMLGIPKVPPNDRSSSQEGTDSAEVMASSTLPTTHTSKLDRRASGPFCVFCNPVKLYREKKRVSEQNRGACGPSRYADLINGFCTETVNILGIPNMDVVSPAAALLRDDHFPVVQEFMGHLFHQMGLLPVLQKPNAVLVFCEPLAMSNAVRMSLLHYLFLRIKVSRVCMVAKPLATCAMAWMDTCVVVDSGAFSTSVAVVLNGQVVPERWKHIPVGGWHVAEYLKQAMQWQPEEYTEIPVSYLDALLVKEKCRLSYNFACEERRKGPARREHINLRVDSYADYKQFWAIRDVTDGLPVNILKECLRHILLTGGNTDLMGFKTRVARDLCELLPEYSTVLNVQMCPGSSSWSVAMGSTYVTMPCSDQPNRTLGSPFWLSREEYILYGCDSFGEAM